MDTRKRLVPTYLARREPRMGQLTTVEWRILLLAPEIPLQLEGAGKGGKHVRGRWRDPGFNIAYPLGRQMFEERIFELIDQGMLPVTHSDMPRGLSRPCATTSGAAAGSRPSVGCTRMALSRSRSRGKRHRPRQPGP
mgnify:CR=1 FL=1